MVRRGIDYREIILHGYNRERGALKLFFIDESEIFKKDGISKTRFFQNLHDAASGMRSILDALITTAMMDIDIYPDAENITFDFIAGNEMATLNASDLDLIIEVIEDATTSEGRSIIDRPSYLEIALLQYYTGVDVLSEDRAAEIAESYGYVARYSGKKLKQVCDDNNQQNKIVRIGSPRHTNDKIKILEKIIDMLPDNLQPKAKQDLSTLKANSKNIYY